MDSTAFSRYASKGPLASPHDQTTTTTPLGDCQPMLNLNTPPNIRCPFKCDKGWIGEPELSLDGKVWTAQSQCAGCGAYSIWDFNPDRPLEEQKLFVKESYEGFWEGPM